MILSVIIPTYNSCKTIRRAINSCLILKDNFEIILVDDGSTDETLKVVKKYFSHELNSQKINIYKANHQGAGAARNVGIKYAKGRWIAFLDSDDEFLNIQILKQDCKRYDSQTTINIVNYSRRYVGLIEGRKLLKANLGIIHNDIWSSEPWGKIYRRSFLINNNICFPTDIKIGEDLIFNQLCLTKNPLIINSNKTVYKQNDNSDSITHLIVKQNILDDSIILTEKVTQSSLSKEIKYSFIVKNFIMTFVRYLKSNYSVSDVIHSINRYKEQFYEGNILKQIITFRRLGETLGSLVTFLSLIIWLYPGTLFLLFKPIQKIRYNS